MATVRFSGELKDRIIKAAKEKMQPAVDRAREAKPSNDWGIRIYHNMFGDALNTLKDVPDMWLRKESSFTVVQVGGITLASDYLTFTLTQPMPWPRGSFVSDVAEPTNSYDTTRITLKDHLVWGEFHAEVTAYCTRIGQATKRRDEFVSAVKKVTEAYTTLAPALKAWPPLWDLIPEDVKQKHREIKAREKTEVSLDVDLNTLTAMATAAKFGV
jgi:hypothetical protein